MMAQNPGMSLNPGMPPNPGMPMNIGPLPPGMPPQMAMPGMPPGMMPLQMNPGMPPMNQMPFVPGTGPHLELRIEEINKRMDAFCMHKPSLNPDQIHQWWDAFASEFFDNDGDITYVVNETKPDSTIVSKKYFVSRNLIPRLFNTYFQTINNMKFVITKAEEKFMNPNFFPHSFAALDGEMDWVLLYPMAEVKAISKFFIEFSPFDEMYSYRIKHMAIELKVAYERSGDEKNSLPLTINGIPPSVLEFLKNVEILEPMRHIMQWQKQSNESPRESMKHLLFSWYKNSSQPQPQMAQAPVPPPEEPKKAPRKRQRKANANGAATGNSKKKGAQAAQTPGPSVPPMNGGGPIGMNQPPFSQGFSSIPMQPHEVMVVAEPTMMGNEGMADNDERTISRVQNTQYDQNANNSIHNLGDGNMMMNPMGMHNNGIMPSGHVMPPNSMGES